MYETMDNKTFAYSIIRKLIEDDKLDKTTLSILCNSDECKRLFNFSGSFTVLKEVAIGCSDEDLERACYDGTKRQRYYKDVLVIDGKGYVICNHWYGPNKSMPDNRTPFLQWAQSKFK